MATTSILFSYLTAWLPLGYAIIFFGTIFEGDVTLFSAAFLTQQGIFNPLFVFILALLGAEAGDLAWYFLGRYLSSHHVSISIIHKWIGKASGPLDHHIERRLTHTVLISKFAYGFNHLALMRVGMKGIKLSEFLKTDILATFFWVLIVGVLGYVSGASFELVKGYLKLAEIGLLLSIIIFFVFWHYIIARQMEKEL